MLVLPERERTKKGAIGVETKGVTCKIPLDLHKLYPCCTNGWIWRENRTV